MRRSRSGAIVCSEDRERHTDTLDSTILRVPQSVRAPFSSVSAMIFSVETSVSATHPAARHWELHEHTADR